jgi:hypothetical protein
MVKEFKTNARIQNQCMPKQIATDNGGERKKKMKETRGPSKRWRNQVKENLNMV